MNSSSLSERLRVDFGDDTYEMEDYKRAIVFVESGGDTDNNVAIKDDTGNVIEDFDLGNGDMAYIDIHADALAGQDDGEFEVDTEANIEEVVVIRGDARYLPVDQSDDVAETIDI